MLVENIENVNALTVNLTKAEREKEEKEKNKYGDIPQWKKNLIIKREKELAEKTLSQSTNIDKYGDIPQWKKDILMKKEKHK